MEHLSYLAALVAALLPTSILAQQPLAPNTFDEQRYERAKVSGGLVIGAMFSRDRLGPGQPVLAAILPGGAAASTTTCLRVTSRDGTYESISTYSLPDTGRDQALSFNHPTQYPELLRDKPAVARMNFGACDQDQPIIPVRWGNAEAAEPGELTLFVNTSGADTLSPMKPARAKWLPVATRSRIPVESNIPRPVLSIPNTCPETVPSRSIST